MKTWRYEAETKTIRSVPENHWIASMNSWDGAENHERNAELIANAPELLAVLQHAIPWLGKMIADGAHQNSVAPQDCERILARAEAIVDKITQSIHA